MRPLETAGNIRPGTQAQGRSQQGWEGVVASTFLGWRREGEWYSVPLRAIVINLAENIGRSQRCLTFDMRGMRQQAKPDVGRPLDGRVRTDCCPNGAFGEQQAVAQDREARLTQGFPAWRAKSE